MNRFGPAPPTNLFEGLTKKIQPSPIKVIQVTIGPRGMDKCRGRINGAPKCIFGGSRLLVSRSSNRLHRCFSACTRAAKADHVLRKSANMVSTLFAPALRELPQNLPQRLKYLLKRFDRG